MRVLVTGSSGQLGSTLVERLESAGGFAVAGRPRAALDITDREAIRAAVHAFRPDWIVNCAAFTRVDDAERNPEAARLVNDAAIGGLAEAARDAGAGLLHVSTDYVFSGEFAGRPRPYREDDAAGPLNVYGTTKLAGEARLRAHPVKSAVVRTSWLYGGPGRNFVSWVIQAGKEAAAARRALRVVADQTGSPTEVTALAHQIEKLIREGAEGLFHASSPGETTWHGLAVAVLARAGIRVRVEPMGRADHGVARRPAYSALENRRLRDLGLESLPRWEEALDRGWERIRSRAGL